MFNTLNKHYHNLSPLIFNHLKNKKVSFFYNIFVSADIFKVTCMSLFENL